MAQTKIPNLCGASAEFNAIQTKFENLMSDAIDGLESNASALSSTIDTAFTSLTTELRALIPEIPSLPDVNLQSLITSLSSLTPGTPEYISLLSEITTKFGTELAAAGHTLDTLITNARTQIEAGGDLCSVVPNFELPAAGGTAKEKSVESKQATIDSEEEKKSTVVKNAEVVLQNSGLIDRAKELMVEVSKEVDVVVGTITSTTAPTSDTGAFTVTDEIKELAFGLKDTLIKVTTPADQDGKNITTGGFAVRKTRAQEKFKDSDVTQSGDTWTIKLSHEPIGIAMLAGNSLTTRSVGSAFQPIPTTEEIQTWVHIAKKGEHIDWATRYHTATSAFYEVDGQSVKITGRGQNFFPHTDTHETYFHDRDKDVEFIVSYDYFANYDPSRVKFN